MDCGGGLEVGEALGESLYKSRREAAADMRGWVGDTGGGDMQLFFRVTEHEEQ